MIGRTSSRKYLLGAFALVSVGLMATGAAGMADMDATWTLIQEYENGNGLWLSEHEEMKVMGVNENQSLGSQIEVPTDDYQPLIIMIWIPVTLLSIFMVVCAVMERRWERE